MSYKNGMAAIRLEMTDKVPRTEYSAAELHIELVNAVLGTALTPDSDKAERNRAASAFRRAWDYGLNWSTDVDCKEFGDIRTKMGHASYAAGNKDFSNEISSYFKDVDDIFRFDAVEMLPSYTHSELVNRFNALHAAKHKADPDLVSTSGTYVTAVSALIDLFGWELLLEGLGEDPDAMGRVLERYSQWIQKYYEAIAESDVEVVMIHDDIVWTSGAFVSPAWYRKYVFPCYRRYVDPLKQAGKKILYTSDGTYTEFIDDIAACHFDGFVLEPTTDMAYIAEKYGKTHAFVGNADTRILLNGTREDIENEVKRCMDIGKNCPGFIMAVGNHIPPNTPVENALWYNECFEKMRRR